MRKYRTIVATMLVFNFLAVPQIAVKAVEAETVRSMVIDSALSEAYAVEGSSTEQNVMLWINDIEHPSTVADDFMTNSQAATISFQSTNTSESNQTEIAEIQEMIAEKRAQSRELYEKHNTSFANQYLNEEDIVYISRYSPVIITSLNQLQVNQLALKEQVTEIALYESSNAAEIHAAEQATLNQTATLATPVATDYLNMINAKTVHKNSQGEGVIIGMIEFYLPNTAYYEDYFNIQDYYPSKDAETHRHATLVASTIREVAPKAELYCAVQTSSDDDDDQDTSYMQAIEWLLDKHVNIINASCPIGDDGHNTYGPASKWLDHIAIQHTVTFVKTAGNDGALGVNSGAMSYNAITVGSVDAYGNLANLSSYNSTTIGLPSKPDLCAPGDNIMSPLGPMSSGTSFAAPQVTGAVALICEQAPHLLIYSETQKAILTAGVSRSYTNSSFNTVPYSNSNNYYMFGAGILDCARNYQIVEDQTYYSGYLDANQTGTFSIETLSLMAGTTIRVSLSHIKYTTLTGNHESLTPITQATFPDLELTLNRNQSLVLTTNAANNYGINVKINTYTSTTSGSYTLNLLAQSASNNTVFFGIAWCIN